MDFVFFAVIIHTVGPKEVNEEKLKQCYENCLNELMKKGLKSIVSVFLA